MQAGILGTCDLKTKYYSFNKMTKRPTYTNLKRWLQFNLSWQHISHNSITLVESNNIDKLYYCFQLTYTLHLCEIFVFRSTFQLFQSTRSISVGVVWINVDIVSVVTCGTHTPVYISRVYSQVARLAVLTSFLPFFLFTWWAQSSAPPGLCGFTLLTMNKHCSMHIHRALIPTHTLQTEHSAQCTAQGK